MQQSQPQPKPPGRRRQNRQHSGRTAAQRSYASENDVANDNAFQSDYMPDGPATPQKSNDGSPAPSTLPAASKNNKRKANKARPKNVSTSPGPSMPGRKSPPQTAGPKPTSALAFAGATFHASPAASSLPIPSFFAKHMPGSPAQKPVGSVSQEPSPPVSDSEIPTPARQPSDSKPPRHESPLDLLFNAQRAEKERARRASSANALAAADGPFSPPSLGGSPQGGNSLRESRQGHRASLQRHSTAGALASEVDGTTTSSQAIGPAFSTPYQERIRAARSSEPQSKPQILQRPPPVTDRSEDLKKFLWGTHLSRSPHDSHSSPRQSQEPPSGNQSSTSPAGGPSNIAAMENSLRQILKLDSPGGSGGPGLFGGNRR